MLTLLVLACTPDKPDTGEDRPFHLDADRWVGVPMTDVGGTPPDADLVVSNSGTHASSGGLELDVTGPFEIEGSRDPLDAGEERTLEVRFTGDTSVPGLYTGGVDVATSHQSLHVDLAAVIADPELPDATWTEDAWGAHTTVALPSAPFPYGDAPYDDASVYLFVPTSLTDDAGVGVVTHLHGHDATIADVIASQHLEEQHALSGRDAVLIVPQGPVNAADSDFGRLMEEDGLANLVRDALSVMYRDGYVEMPSIGPVVLTAHSGGYLAAAEILDHGGLPITAVHLFDALYGDVSTFENFVADGGTLRSSYTATGGTDGYNQSFAAALDSLGIHYGTTFDDEALATDTVTIGPVDSTHAGCVSDERNYARWLAASGLPDRPDAPPELLSVTSNGTQSTVTWRADPGGRSIIYRVEGSEDGRNWGLLTDTDTNSAVVPADAWIRVVKTDASWGDSDPSDVYGGTGDDWLIVDGFDRVLDGSWSAPTHDFAAKIGVALGAPFSVASNEAVASGAVSLSDYSRVLWMLGDESVADVTFDDREKAAIEAYLAGPGRLVVSGSEVGYATDPTWLSDVLHATYVADDADTDQVQDWTFGAEYPEDYPDVLDGDEVLWTYGTGGGAAVGWEQRVVVVGFGLENLRDIDRAVALPELAAWLR
jgi:hypothetical protein